MNYGEIINEIGNLFTSSDPARCKLWANAAYHEILAHDLWSFLEATSAAVPLVASQQNYILGGTSAVIVGYGSMLDVTMELTTSGARVKLFGEMKPQDFDRLSAHSFKNGVPAMYTIMGGVLPTAGSANVVSGAKVDLQVWPKPTASAGEGVNLFLKYSRNAADIEMTANADLPIIPVQHHYAIIELACSIGLIADDQIQQAQAYRQMAEARIAVMQTEDLTRRSGDNERWVLEKQPTLPAQAPLTQAKYDPDHRGQAA